jgi:putative ubiquitin-RnfH superfamily antitoxin RatB of RatAB toxin-antitoxin module
MKSVELVYQDIHKNVYLIAVDWFDGMTIQDVIDQTRCVTRNPELLTQNVGVYGQKMTHQDRVFPGDRVEFYPPLLVDPKEARRKRSKPKAK